MGLLMAGEIHAHGMALGLFSTLGCFGRFLGLLGFGGFKIGVGGAEKLLSSLEEHLRIHECRRGRDYLLIK